MPKPIIGYDNKLTTGTLSASSDPAETPKEDSIDWRFDDYWQPAAATENWLEVDLGSAQSIDYVAIYSSDFYTMTGANLTVLSGAASPPATSRVNQNITTRGPKLLTFTSASARYWRIRLQTTGSETPKIQMLALGSRLDLETGLREGHAPPSLAQRREAISSVSQGGFFIGRSTKIVPVNFNLRLTNLTSTWLRNNWPALLAHIEAYPFFMQPDPDNASDEVAICWLSDNAQSAPQWSETLMELNLQLKAFT